MDYKKNINRVCGFTQRNPIVPIMEMVFINGQKLSAKSYEGSAICDLPDNFKGITACVVAKDFQAILGEFPIEDVKVSMKGTTILFTGDGKKATLPTHKDQIEFVMDSDQTHTFTISEEVLSVVSDMLPLCGHRTDGKYNVVYLTKDSIFTTEGNHFAFCKIDAGVDYNFNGLVFRHLYGGDSIGIGGTNVTFSADGIQGSVVNDNRYNISEHIYGFLEGISPFAPSGDEIDLSIFATISKMAGALSCDYIKIGANSISAMLNHVDKYTAEVNLPGIPDQVIPSDVFKRIAGMMKEAVKIQVIDKKIIAFESGNCLYHTRPIQFTF
jgi:hypothetical protein